MRVMVCYSPVWFVAQFIYPEYDMSGVTPDGPSVPLSARFDAEPLVTASYMDLLRCTFWFIKVQLELIACNM